MDASCSVISITAVNATAPRGVHQRPHIGGRAGLGDRHSAGIQTIQMACQLLSSRFARGLEGIAVSRAPGQVGETDANIAVGVLPHQRGVGSSSMGPRHRTQPDAGDDRLGHRLLVTIWEVLKLVFGEGRPVKFTVFVGSQKRLKLSLRSFFGPLRQRLHDNQGDGIVRAFIGQRGVSGARRRDALAIGGQAFQLQGQSFPCHLARFFKGIAPGCAAQEVGECYAKTAARIFVNQGEVSSFHHRLLCGRNRTPDCLSMFTKVPMGTSGWGWLRWSCQVCQGGAFDGGIQLSDARTIPPPAIFSSPPGCA